MRHRNAFFAVDQLASHADQLLRVILQTRREYREKGMLIHRMKTTYLTLDFRSFRGLGERSCWSAVTAVVYVSGEVVGVSA